MLIYVYKEGVHMSSLIFYFSLRLELGNLHYIYHIGSKLSLLTGSASIIFSIIKSVKFI